MYELCEDCGSQVFYDSKGNLVAHNCFEEMVLRDEWLADCYRDEKMLDTI